jgi:hypothetical protein
MKFKIVKISAGINKFLLIMILKLQNYLKSELLLIPTPITSNIYAIIIIIAIIAIIFNILFILVNSIH